MFFIEFTLRLATHNPILIGSRKETALLFFFRSLIKLYLNYFETLILYLYFGTPPIGTV